MITPEPTHAPTRWRSSFILVTSVLAIFALFTLAYPMPTLVASARARVLPSHAACDAARRWNAKYAQQNDLHVITVDVTFRGDPGGFVPGEATIVVPVAVDLAGSQDVLEIDGDPPPARVLRAGGNVALAWPYAGALHHDIRALGLALVRRPPVAALGSSDPPRFDLLPPEERSDAMLTAADLEEHGLDQCRAFARWAVQTAGAPPHTDQLARLVRWLTARTGAHSKRTDDLCAALREGVFTQHEAHVLAVMAARQVGVPAYGFIGAQGTRTAYYVATYVDGSGWVTLDLRAVEKGYTAGGPALVTMAPLIGRFEANEDRFWDLSGAAYEDTGLGMVRTVSRTRWANASDPGDTTVVREVPLRDACQEALP